MSATGDIIYTNMGVVREIGDSPVPHPSRKKVPSHHNPDTPHSPHNPPTSTNTTTTTNTQITQIYEGTNQICRMVAGRQILADAQKR